MTKSRWIVFALLCVLSLGGLVLLSKDKKVDIGSVDATKMITSGEHADHIYGTPTAKVVLMEYGDFQCPGCGSAYPQLKAIKQAYKDRIAFVFRHFPLTAIHPNALAAAAAAEAASKQGKFWQMHDKLYETQSSWENASTSKRGEIFASFASELGLDTAAFSRDIASEAATAAVSYDRALGGKMDVSATPTLFLNGKKLPQDVTSNVAQGTGDSLRKEIDQALK